MFYSYSGNVAGRLPYQPGYPKCTGYGMHTSKDYPGLCRIDDYENTIDGKPYVYSPYDSRYSRPGSSSVSSHNNQYNNKFNQLRTQTSRPSTSSPYRQNIGYQSGDGHLPINQNSQQGEVRIITYSTADEGSVVQKPAQAAISNINKALAGYRWDLLFKDLIKDIV